MAESIEVWLAAAIADARQRDLPELEPLLIALARSTAALRNADAELRRRAQPGPPKDSGGR